MWLFLAFISAALLGVYDTFKKVSLNQNAVIPVLFLNTIFCSLLFVPIIVMSWWKPDFMQQTLFYVPKVPLSVHPYIMLKAVIVLSSWIFVYFATKHLPITISSNIKATQPVLTLLGALIIFGEQLNAYQWLGVAMALLSLYLLSQAGGKEGIRFTGNKWILFMVMGIITGAISGLYDKFLMERFDRMTVQVWYNFYQAVIMFFIWLFLWYPKRKNSTKFQWKYSIFFISFFLVLADFAYFYALSYEDSMISIVSMVRRSGVVVSFLAGALFFHEKNIKSKAIDLLLMLIGMFFLYLGSR